MSHVALTKCVFCGEDKKEIALSKNLNKNAFPDSSKSVIVDFDPCRDCMQNWTTGVALVPIQRYDEQIHGKIPKKLLIVTGAEKYSYVPLGGYIVLDEDSEFCKNFNKDNPTDMLEKGKVVFINKDFYEYLLQIGESEQKDGE